MITLFATPLITDHIKVINEILMQRGDGKLSNRQQWFLAFCLLGLLITQSLCWERFSRAGLGDAKPGALSKMFIHSQICWERLLAASLKRLLKEYGTKGGTLDAVYLNVPMTEAALKLLRDMKPQLRHYWPP